MREEGSAPEKIGVEGVRLSEAQKEAAGPYASAHAPTAKDSKWKGASSGRACTEFARRRRKKKGEKSSSPVEGLRR